MDKAQAPTPANEPAVQAMPGPLPRPPGRPPAEPIVIRTPPRRPRDDLEIDGSVDEEEWRRDQATAGLGPGPAAAATARGTRGAAVAATSPHGPASAPSCS